MYDPFDHIIRYVLLLANLHFIILYGFWALTMLCMNFQLFSLRSSYDSDLIWYYKCQRAIFFSQNKLFHWLLNSSSKTKFNWNFVLEQVWIKRIIIFLFGWSVVFYFFPSLNVFLLFFIVLFHVNSKSGWYLEKTLQYSSDILVFGLINAWWWCTFLSKSMTIYMIIMGPLLLGRIRVLDHN